MRRTWLLVVCLLASAGCNSAQKSMKPSAEARPADSPKEYPYRDMSTNSAIFSRK